MGSPTLSAPHAPRRSPDAPYVFVSVADLRHADVSNAIISTLGLGSCLGVTAYDPVKKIGAMLHAMLPDSRKHRRDETSTAMYLDTGVPALIETAVRLGTSIAALEFKVFGGAQILQSNDYFSIGHQNVEMMQQLAAQYRLRVKAWDVGGQSNRSIELHLHHGRVRLRMPSQPEVWI